MNSLILLVLGMAIVTYIPRMVPMVIFQNIVLPPYLKRFLEFVPYSVLGALIFPSILSSTDNMGSAIFGGIISIILALFNTNIIFVVLGGISGVYLWNLFI
ncbi:branched-chain amino acid transporter [Vulcanibacillus modesticaldus]|uniref:Branched-chain amino acid transporter n=1 Tax=Vulcanibacillus modesticaldus TaxID=337097 RepID=A0A1D2YTM7_9BACI|nr:AzlD domain-containing protein [Vulcanibacillus modesticaldus]OEF99037.1 branched-chain amino acid transporter [Vulcanibacillus modesticaldus]